MYTSTKKAKCGESLKLPSCVSNKRWSIGQQCSMWSPCWRVTHKSWWQLTISTNGMNITNKLESHLIWIDKIAASPWFHPHPPIQAVVPWCQAQAQAGGAYLHIDLKQAETWSWVIMQWRVVDRRHSSTTVNFEGNWYIWQPYAMSKGTLTKAPIHGQIISS